MSSSTCHEAAPQPLLTLQVLRIVTAATTVADSHSDRPMKRSDTHSNTATQQPKLTTSTVPPTDITEQHAHTAPQLNTARHCTPNMQVSTIVTHNGCTHAHNRKQQCRAESLRNTCTNHGASRCRLLHYRSATLRLRHARSQDTCRRTSSAQRSDCQRQPQPRTTHAHATPLSHYKLYVARV
jgi:hypothetical protein